MKNKNTNLRISRNGNLLSTYTSMCYGMLVSGGISGRVESWGPATDVAKIFGLSVAELLEIGTGGVSPAHSGAHVQEILEDNIIPTVIRKGHKIF